MELNSDNTWINKEIDTPVGPPERDEACQHLVFSLVRPLPDVRSTEMQNN